ncbi:MAG TPA: PD-(D/E)XK nuclease family protein [Solirubrobacteraceae bacterium]|nr:PD-(D/E)XK nuclease family protein [Solirubrobacteraceae bacterium]
MPLNLVLGPANAAKAGEVLGAYALAAQRDALLVVPTAADVAYYERELAAPGVTLGRASTFSGLLDEVALRTRYRRQRVTPLQRDRVLRRAIASLRLETLAPAAAGIGFAHAARRLIIELEQQRVDPARFAQALKSWSAAQAQRAEYARELAAIYRRYRDELERLERVDSETFAWGALDALRESPESWGATPVFLYGFDDLTPIELDAVETLARQAGAAVTVSLTYEPDRPALAVRASVVEELRALAESVTQLPALDEYYASDSRAPLHHLERHLFEPDPPVIEPVDAVTLMEAGSERTEAELVAAEVLAALRDGVDSADLVIVCRSLAHSADVFERALARFGVACTSARVVPLGHTTLGRALLGLVRYALLPGSQRDAGDLLAYLRHPGVADNPDDVDRFELRVRRQGGRVAAALRASGTTLGAAFAEIERLRLASERFEAVAESTRSLIAAPHRGQAPLLGAAERLDARAASVVFTALDELGQLDEGRLAAAELVELLEGLQVPVHGTAAPGEVLVAEPLAIRARRFRRVFVTGLCEGEFPSAQATSGDPFLDDERRRELALSTGLVLAQAADPLDRERYLLYACVSRATERVTFSYRSSDEDGNVVIASPFLDDIAELFPEHWRERRSRRLLADVAWSVAQAPTERDRLVAATFERSAGGAGGSGQGAAAGGEPPATRVLSDQALSHVRHREVVSAGAIEKFASCPVRWLVESQLNPDLLEPEADPLVRGSFIHVVLERVFSRLGQALTSESLAPAERLLSEEMRGSAAAEHRSKLAIDQATEVRAAILRGIEAELLRYLRQEAADGSAWPPAVTEFRFGLDGDGEDAVGPVELTASDGEHARLHGIVDRIDADPGNSERVIVRDYKSGSKRETWPSARWVSDNQVQVALYMIAVQRLLGVEAVAGFYQPLAGEDLRPRGVYSEGVEVGSGVVARDGVPAEERERLLDEIEDQVVALAVTLRRGELTPCPDSCTPDGTCRYPGICWAAR